MKSRILVVSLVFTVFPALMQAAPVGFIIRPGSGAREVTIINDQVTLPQRDIEEIAQKIENLTAINFNVVQQSTGKKTMPDGESAVVLTVKDVPSEPIMLLATEDHWGSVNLANIVKDLPSQRARQKFFVPRARKLIIKALSLLCGGGSSQFPNNIMNTASVRKLDSVKESIPADMIDYYKTYLQELGCTQKEFASYEEACEEGWAPQPTNDIQKAIWEKVHNPPTKPLKISYDKAAQKPVVK